MTDCAGVPRAAGRATSSGALERRGHRASWNVTSSPARAAGGSTASWPVSRRCSTWRAPPTLSSRRRRPRSRRPCSTVLRANAAAWRPRPGRHRRALRVGAALAAAAVAVAIVLVATGAFSSSPGKSYFGHVRLTGGRGAAYATSGRCGRARSVQLRRARPRRRFPGPSTSSGASRPRPVGQRRHLQGRLGRRAEVELTSAARPGDYERLLITRRSEDERRVVLAGRVEY